MCLIIHFLDLFVMLECSYFLKEPDLHESELSGLACSLWYLDFN